MSDTVCIVTQEGHKLRFGVMALVFNTKGEIFVGRNKPDHANQKYPGVWELPTGGVERKHVTVENTVRKEVWEELGVDETAIFVRMNKPMINVFPDPNARHDGRVLLTYAVIINDGQEINIYNNNDEEGPTFDQGKFIALSELRSGAYGRTGMEDIYAELPKLFEPVALAIKASNTSLALADFTFDPHTTINCAVEQISREVHLCAPRSQVSGTKPVPATGRPALSVHGL